MEITNSAETSVHNRFKTHTGVCEFVCVCGAIYKRTSWVHLIFIGQYIVNPLTPNDPYRGRTAPLTSKLCILYIYSTNIGTEYFKHGIYSPYFIFKMQFVS